MFFLPREPGYEFKPIRVGHLKEGEGLPTAVYVVRERAPDGTYGVIVSPTPLQPGRRGHVFSAKKGQDGWAFYPEGHGPIEPPTLNLDVDRTDWSLRKRLAVVLIVASATIGVGGTLGYLASVQIDNAIHQVITPSFSQ